MKKLLQITSIFILLISIWIPAQNAFADTYSCSGVGCTAIDTNGCSSNSITGQSACGCSNNGSEIVCTSPNTTSASTQTSTCVNGKTASGLTCVPITTSSGVGNSLTNGTVAANSNCPNNGQMVNGVCNLGYTPLEPIPGVTDTNLTSPQGFAGLVNAIFRIMITAGALLAVLMLTLGGVQYMTANSIGNKTQGLDRARAAIYGILLLAAIYLILNTINPHLLNFDFIACPGGTATCGTAATVTNTNANTTTASSNACGTDPTFAQGCPANYSCGSTIVEGGGQGYSCVPSSSANASCNSASGEWTLGGTGYYCYLPQYSNQQTCSSAGGSWTNNWVQSNYCYK